MSSAAKPSSEAGGIFFYILLGVVLFASLSFVLTRSMRGTSVDLMSARQSELAASDMISYAQNIARGVDKVRRKGCSENDISFDHTSWGHTDYQHSPVVDDECKVFHTSGGSVSFEAMSRYHDQVLEDVNSISFVGQSEINNLGQTCGAASCVELYLVVRMINASILCTEINNILDISSTLPVSAGVDNATIFDGTFAYASTLSDGAFDGEIAGCYQHSSQTHSDGTPYYDFYYVLLER